MRPISPWSLLLFIQLATSAPIRIPRLHGASTEYRCAFASCREYPSSDHRHTIKISEPHFPAHQLSLATTPEEAVRPIDNRPYTPTTHILHSEALAAETPLSSSYLKSLADETTTALPSKPTSALADLRKEDARRYWASLPGSLGQQNDGNGDDMLVSELPPAPGRRVKCGSYEVERIALARTHAASTGYVVREYGDVMVVGLVLLFLVIVVGIEAVEKFATLGSGSVRYRRRHGKIFLKDDGEDDWVVKSHFHQQHAPSSFYKISVGSEKGLESDQFDSDADERV